MGCSSSKQKNNCDLCDAILDETYYECSLQNNKITFCSIECFESIFGINDTLLDF